MNGQSTTIEELLKMKFVLFSPERIAGIRKTLGKSPQEFAEYFFLTKDAVINWESPEGTTKYRELNGPAARIMLGLEGKALIKRTDFARALRSLVKRERKALHKRFKYVLK